MTELSTRRARRRGDGGAVRRFLRWWGRELAALVPVRLRPARRPAAATLWVHEEPSGLVFRRLAGGRLHEVGRLTTPDDEEDPAALRMPFEAQWARLGRKPIGVPLRPEQVLRRSLDLPLAARDNLDQVLRFELSRCTPFVADQAYFDYRVEREDLRAGRLRVGLTVAPRSAVDGVLRRLRGWGVPVRAVMVEDELADSGHCADLLPVGLRPRTLRLWPWLYAGMAAVTLGLLALALALPLWQKREVAIALMPREAAAAAEAAEVNELRTELDRQTAVYNFTLERKLAAPPLLAVLEEVTRVLPDDTWLQQLEIRGDRVVMQGGSGAPVRLIGLIENSRLLADANFTSPLVSGRQGDERFQLEAAFEPIVLADAVAAQRALQAPKPRPAGKRAERSR